MPSLTDQTAFIANDQIAKLIGENRFERVRQQFDQFKIDVREQSKQACEALVDGFHVKLSFRNKNIEGACSCPESDGFDFCIHCAGLCLYLNRNNQQIATLAKGPDKSKVLAYLLSQDKQKLAKDFLALLSHDAELFDRYLLRASLNQDELDYTSLKSRVTELTRKPEKLFSQRQVKHFFARIERFIDELNSLEHYSNPEKMLKVVEHLFQRLNRLLDEIDDNSGQRGDCVETFRRLYPKLLAQIHGKNETKAKRLLKLWLSDKYSVLPAKLEEILEPEQSQEFTKLLDRICVQKDKKYSASDYSQSQQDKMRRYLLDTYLARGETDKLAALSAKMEQP